jgi:hypothetical protein
MQPNPYAAPVPTDASRRATGKELLNASWGMLRQDRELLWLPVLGALACLVAAGLLFVPGWFIGGALGGTDHHSWAGSIGGVFAAAAATVAGVFFQAALVIGANERADGGDPTLQGCLRSAWARRGRILSWGLLSATVGVAIRALERRLGVFGSLLGFLGGLAWAIASFLVVPVLVAEDLGPVASVKRSAQLIKSTWGTSLRTTLRFGLIQLALTLVPVFVGVVGIVAVASGSTVATVIGVLLLVVAVAGFLGLAMVFTAIGSYARALIYRYSTGRPVPGIDPVLFTGVFQPKKRSRRRRFA